MSQRCPWPHKRAYRSVAKARKAIKRFSHKKDKLNIYYCETGGHYHLGRATRRRSREQAEIERYARGENEES